MLVFWGYFLTRRSKERAAASKELQPSVPSAMPSVAIPLEGDAGQPVEADSELPTDFASAWAWHGDASRGGMRACAAGERGWQSAVKW